MTTTQTAQPVTTCPSWCTGEHENRVNQQITPAGDFYGGDVVHASVPSRYGSGPALSVQQYPGLSGNIIRTVVLDDQDLTEAEAHELGMALVRAADRIRRDRMEAGQ